MGISLTPKAPKLLVTVIHGTLQKKTHEEQTPERRAGFRIPSSPVDASIRYLTSEGF